ncbi:MAG: hypothetical protein MI757_07725 [Pirellulales bacterium]|nr:hypothetical protein [Pirellulales bacterium]
MTSSNFERVLSAVHRRTPFRPFTVELVSGTQIVVDHPEALVMRGGVAVYLSKEGVPTLFDHEGVSRVDGDNTVASSS